MGWLSLKEEGREEDAEAPCVSGLVATRLEEEAEADADVGA